MTSPELLSSLDALADHVRAQPARRVLILTGPSRRHLDAVQATLGDAQVQIFDGAEVHVPREVVDAARVALKGHQPDLVVSVGGGAATGLAKALRREHDFRFVAVATTYSASEMTNIWGITDDNDKQTGRDDRVRPDVVVHDAQLTLTLPRGLTVRSLLNAVAQPVSALSTASLDGEARATALRALKHGLRAAEQLVAWPEDEHARREALRATADAGRTIDVGRLGPHHKLAHRLGGRFGLEHAALHAVLLPRTLAWLADERPALLDEIAKLIDRPDPVQHVYDLLQRAGGPIRLEEMGVERDALEQELQDFDGPGDIARDAFNSGRPSARNHRADWGLRRAVVIDGELSEAELVVVTVHGRGSTASAILDHARQITGHVPEVALVAPQAPGNSWYSSPYRDPKVRESDELEVAVAEVERTIARVRELAPDAAVALFGFSQGACLSLEVSGRTEHDLFAVVALSGGLPHPTGQARRELRGTRVLLSVADGDPWLNVHDVRESAETLASLGADVTFLSKPGKAHRITALERARTRDVLLADAEPPRGFLAALESEVLKGAVPRDQNAPRLSPYGLYPELVSGTGFVAERHENLRAWFYRLRPAPQMTGYEPVDARRITADFEAVPETSVCAWSPETLPADDDEVDFVDGLVTLGGAGHPAQRRGYALHRYAANRSMDDRSFVCADGDLLFLPEHGRLLLQTEAGFLDVAPGELAVLPRGLRVSVHLPDREARGYVGEIYARHFHLPERGLVGHNGLADERHFRAPRAAYEDRLAPGYRMTVKMGGGLLEAVQDYSPYDVVGWHGNYVPFAYDLSMFAPHASVRVDHQDPSIFTVLSAGMDEQGAHALDLVVFPPRWEATEHSFRPPFFHRNVTTEINGIIKNPAAGRMPFPPGLVFLTPSMTPHGVMAASVQRQFELSEEQANRPNRLSEDSLWFQFETALPFHPSKWAKDGDTRIRDWVQRWGAHSSRFDPSS